MAFGWSGGWLERRPDAPTFRKDRRMNEKLVAKVMSYRWLVFAVLAIAYALVYVHRVSLSVVANDLVRDFGVSAGTIGLLGSIYFYCYAAMQFPSGLLSDSVGPRKTVTYSLLIAAVGSILFGLAPSIPVAILGRALIGVGVSMVFIPTMKILSQWYRAGEFAHMGGIFQAAGGIGTLAGTFLLGLLAVAVGWRWSFHIIAGGTLAVIAGAWFVVRNRPADKGWPSIQEIEHRETAVVEPIQEIGLREGIRRVVSEKYFWPVAVWFFFDCGVFFGFGMLWSGPYLMHNYGMSKAEAGAILSMLAWGMIIGGPGLGVLSQRVLKSRKKTKMLCMAVLTVLLAIATLYPAGLPRPLLLVWFFLFSVSSSPIVIMGFTTTKELFPLQIAGTSVGLVNIFPFLGGAVFMYLLGWLLDGYPKSAAGQYPVEAYQMLMLALLLASISALACTFLMKDTYRS